MLSVCSLLLREFSRQYKVLGSHRGVSVCTLPPSLPKRVVDKIMLSFALDLAEILSGLDTITRKRAVSRVSVESAQVMFLVDIPSEDDQILECSLYPLAAYWSHYMIRNILVCLL